MLLNQNVHGDESAIFYGHTCVKELEWYLEVMEMMHKSSAEKKITLGRRFYLRLRKKQSCDLHFILIVQESLLLIKILKLEKGGRMVD